MIAFGLEMLALHRMTRTAFGTLLSIEPAFGIAAGAAAQRGGARPTDAVTTTDVAASATKETL